MADDYLDIHPTDGRPMTSSPHDYEERIRSQTLSWAMGKPYHDRVTDECCPDFSCCYPDLFTADDAERWRHYREKHGSTDTTS